MSTCGTPIYQPAFISSSESRLAETQTEEGIRKAGKC